MGFRTGRKTGFLEASAPSMEKIGGRGVETVSEHVGFCAEFAGFTHI